ncbi:hypothetical protein B0A49_07154 [Cryomyces minteri]|uniref:Uncharacterized protein n=1 Tax=Cryomyces minteri TaxID=331657 RepID=A0A4U0WTQ4_9PEZI|nr:hypothetical protein B0A49_07154 [Cryomyces minteri]
METHTDRLFEPIDDRLMEMIFLGDPGFFFMSWPGWMYYMWHNLRKGLNKTLFVSEAQGFQLSCQKAQQAATYQRTYQRWWDHHNPMRPDMADFRVQILKRSQDESLKLREHWKTALRWARLTKATGNKRSAIAAFQWSLRNQDQMPSDGHLGLLSDNRNFEFAEHLWTPSRTQAEQREVERRQRYPSNPQFFNIRQLVASDFHTLPHWEDPVSMTRKVFVPLTAPVAVMYPPQSEFLQHSASRRPEPQDLPVGTGELVPENEMEMTEPTKMETVVPVDYKADLAFFSKGPESATDLLNWLTEARRAHRLPRSRKQSPVREQSQNPQHQPKSDDDPPPHPDTPIMRPHAQPLQDKPEIVDGIPRLPRSPNIPLRVAHIQTDVSPFQPKSQGKVEHLSISGILRTRRKTSVRKEPWF